MTERKVVIVEGDKPAAQATKPGDELAYMLPMAVFLVFTFIGGQWPSTYPLTYVLKTIIVTALIFAMRRHYTPIVWKWWWVGAIVGVLILLQWVGMESWLLKTWPNYPRMSHEVFNPFEYFTTRQKAWAFIAVRLAGASLLVPVMEELFWRDFLWRSSIWPTDFKQAAVGQWDWKTFLFVAVIFGAGVHIEWATAIVCGLIFGGLLVLTRSLGACIIAHGVTNFLLGLYVLRSGQWHFW